MTKTANRPMGFGDLTRNMHVIDKAEMKIQAMAEKQKSYGAATTEDEKESSKLSVYRCEGYGQVIEVIENTEKFISDVALAYHDHAIKLTKSRVYMCVNKEPWRGLTITRYTIDALDKDNLLRYSKESNVNTYEIIYTDPETSEITRLYAKNTEVACRLIRQNFQVKSTPKTLREHLHDRPPFMHKKCVNVIVLK